MGSYTLTFKSVTGWTTPASQNVTITKGVTSTATGTYVQTTGSLTVNIGPAAAVTAGAAWSINGGTTWQSSGATVSGIATGPCTLTFKSVTGWTAPYTTTFNVVKGGAYTATATYVSQAGAFTVTINPAAAVTSGAAWSIDGGATWQLSGATVSGLTPGSYSLSFKNVTGWKAPGSTNFTLNTGTRFIVNGTYSQTGTPKMTSKRARIVPYQKPGASVLRSSAQQQ